MQRDPLGYLDGLNLHQYVGSDPLGNGDPLGLELHDTATQMIINRDKRARSSSSSGGSARSTAGLTMWELAKWDIARVFLEHTGGIRITYLDRVGNNIGGRRLPSQWVGDIIIMTGTRRHVKPAGPGWTVGGKTATTATIFQKRALRRALGLTILSARIVGKFFIVVTIIDGAYAVVIIPVAFVQEAIGDRDGNGEGDGGSIDV